MNSAKKTTLYSILLFVTLAGFGGCDPQKEIDAFKAKAREIHQTCDDITIEFETEHTVISNPTFTDELRLEKLHPLVLVKCDKRGYNESQPYINYPYLEYKTLLENRAKTLTIKKQKLFDIVEAAQKLIDKARLSLKGDSEKTIEYRLQIEQWQQELLQTKESLLEKINSLTLFLNELKQIIIVSATFDNEKKRYASEQIIRDVRDIKTIVAELKTTLNEIQRKQQTYDVRQDTANIYRLVYALTQYQENNNLATLIAEIRALRVEVNRLKQQLNNN
ncbi:MAG: hypothetical protein WD068_01285, partial [Candidatus Babeliales bacterium]